MKSPPEASAGPITVLIADDHPLEREGLAAIFRAQNDIRVVAEATNGKEASELCNRHLLR
jgi:YesN/AraC family two-component response regulator